MIFIKAAHAGEIVPVASMLGRLDALLAAAPLELAPAIPDSAPAGAGDISLPTPAPAPKEEEAGVEVAVPPPAPVAEDIHAAPSVRAVQRDWDGFVGHVKERKKWMASALELSVKAQEEDGELVVKFDDPSECLYLQDAKNIKLLAEFAQDFFQRDLTVKIVVSDGQPGEKQGSGEAQEERRTLARDPRVEMAVEVLDGEIAGIRTGPRSR
jgi:DNA polymerase-3 subunit gamma/tau